MALKGIRTESARALAAIEGPGQSDGTGNADSDHAWIVQKSTNCWLWGSREFEFSDRAAKAIVALHSDLESGGKGLSSGSLLDAAGSTGRGRRVRDIFKLNGNEIHDALGTMIVREDKRYLIKPPENIEIPTYPTSIPLCLSHIGIAII